MNCTKKLINIHQIPNKTIINRKRQLASDNILPFSPPENESHLSQWYKFMQKRTNMNTKITKYVSNKI